MGCDDDCVGNTPGAEVSLQHDWEHDESVSATILAAVAAVTNTPLTELDPPLYEVVDPDALDTLCQPLTDDVIRDGSGRLRFPLHECTVTLSWDGTIKIDPPDE